MDIPGAFATGAVSVSEDLVPVSDRFQSEVEGEQNLAFLTYQFPYHDFRVVPPLAGDVTRDLDVFIWPVRTGHWVVFKYPSGSGQASSIEPTLRILEKHDQTIHRVPGLEPVIRDDVNTIPNYTNGVLLNEAALVPAYGVERITSL